MITINVAKGVGFCRLNDPTQDTLLFGYFQSYRWITQSGVIDKFRNIELLKESQDVNSYVTNSSGLRILGVHIRLGDYKAESDFGIISEDYYRTSLSRIFSTDAYDKIWIFSDEPQLAQAVHTLTAPVPIEWIENRGLSAAETLQLFRRCDGYIIANSSFSWWAAMLSHSENPKVIAPDRWFKNLEEPIDLIPPSWVRIKTSFLSAEQVSSLSNRV